MSLGDWPDLLGKGAGAVVHRIRCAYGDKVLVMRLVLALTNENKGALEELQLAGIDNRSRVVFTWYMVSPSEMLFKEIEAEETLIGGIFLDVDGLP